MLCSKVFANCLPQLPSTLSGELLTEKETAMGSFQGKKCGAPVKQLTHYYSEQKSYQQIVNEPRVLHFSAFISINFSYHFLPTWW